MKVKELIEFVNKGGTDCTFLCYIRNDIFNHFYGESSLLKGSIDGDSINHTEFRYGSRRGKPAYTTEDDFYKCSDGLVKVTAFANYSCGSYSDNEYLNYVSIKDIVKARKSSNSELSKAKSKLNGEIIIDIVPNSNNHESKFNKFCRYQ